PDLAAVECHCAISVAQSPRVPGWSMAVASAPPRREAMSATPACACPDPVPPSLERRGLAWLFARFVFCPCHLPLTLWLLTSVLSGCALAFVTRHGVVVAVATVVLWVVMTAYALRLLWRARSERYGADPRAGSTEPRQG